MNNVRNKSGFSLLEIVIAMGLAAGLLVFYMKMQTEQAKNAKTAKVNQEVETFSNDFKGVITRPGFCDKSFENVSLSDSNMATITQIKNPRGDIKYEVGQAYGNNSLKLSSITLKNFKPDDKEGLEGIAILEIGIERMGNIYGAKKIIKNFDVSVSRNQAQKIISCGSLSAGGGLNVNIIAPAATTTAPATKNTETSSTTSSTTSTSTSSPSSDAPATQPSSPSSASPSQEEMLKQLQNDPQFKQMQEAIKNMKGVDDTIEE